MCTLNKIPQLDFNQGITTTTSEYLRYRVEVEKFPAVVIDFIHVETISWLLHFYFSENASKKNCTAQN